MRFLKYLRRGTAITTLAALSIWPAAGSAAAKPVDANYMYATILAVHGKKVTVRDRSGTVSVVDLTAAGRHTGLLPLGQAVVLYGRRTTTGDLKVDSVGHASPVPEEWPPDN